MQRIVLPLLAVALIGSPVNAQTVVPPQGLGGQGMGGSAAFVNPFGGQAGNALGAQMGNMGSGWGQGRSLNGSGFVPGGQNMGGSSLSMNQYMGMMFMRSMAGRNGSSGPHRGVSNPFVTPQYPGMNNAGQGQQMSLAPPKTHSTTPKLTPEERKATVRRIADERKAKALEAAAKKKAKVAVKAPVAKAPAAKVPAAKDAQ